MSRGVAQNPTDRRRTVSRAVVLAVLAVVSLTACGDDPAPGTSPPHSASGSSTSVPGVPEADVEFRPLLESYPSAWDALGLEPASTPADMWQVTLDDGSVLSVEARDGGGARVNRVAPGGTATPLTEWLPTDRGQAWGAIAYSDPWLVYADDAGSHTDGPVTAAGVLLANTDTGAITALEHREYAAPREPCDECGDWLFFTEATIGRSAVYWTVGGPLDQFLDAPVKSRPLAGGETSDLFAGSVHFVDASCVTTPGAEVRVSGVPREVGEYRGTVMWTWDLGPTGATLVSPADGMTGGANNVEPSTCAGVDVIGWMTPLDGEPLGDSITKWSEEDPNILLSAIDFVGPAGRARVRFDDDFALFQVTSRIDGWAVIGYQGMGSVDYRFLLFDIEGRRLYEVDAPPGMSLARAAVSNGRLFAYVGTEPSGTEPSDGGWHPSDTLLSAALP